MGSKSKFWQSETGKMLLSKKTFILIAFIAVLGIPVKAQTYTILNVSNNVLSLPFDEGSGTTLYDYSPWKSNFTLSSASGWTTGRWDNGYNFSDVYNASRAWTPSLNLSTQFTVSAWVKTGEKAIGIFYHLGDIACSDVGFQMGQGVTGAGVLNTHFGGRSWLGANTPMNTSGWNHIAYVYNGTHGIYYFNATPDGVQATLPFTASGSLNIIGSCGNTHYFNGVLDSLQIWNTTLSVADIQAVMATSIRDLTPATSITLLINGAGANLTTECTAKTTNNYTAQINTTGLNVSILYNGTHAVTNLTKASWYSSLIAGYWNITANFTGNASYESSSKTLYHNITLGTAEVNLTTNATSNTTCLDTPIQVNCSSWDLEDGQKLYNDTAEITMPSEETYASVGLYNFTCNWTANDCKNAGSKTLTITASNCSTPTINTSSLCLNIPEGVISTKTCINNDTLEQLFQTGNDTCAYYQTCITGCDNYTLACSPPVYQQNLLVYGSVLFFGLLLVLMWRRRR